MIQKIITLLMCVVLGSGCVAPYQPPALVQDPWDRTIITREGPGTYATIQREQPVVVFNSQYWGWFPQEVQDFAWWHEVAHHQMGHVTLPASHGRAAEAVADCEAIRTVDPDPAALLPILNTLQDMTEDKDHAPGDERAAHVLMCWATGRGARW